MRQDASTIHVAEEPCAQHCGRGEEAKWFSKAARESDQCNTTRNTTRYTTRNTTEMLAGAAFWSFEAFKEWNENTSQFFGRGPAAPGSISVVLRVVLRVV